MPHAHRSSFFLRCAPCAARSAPGGFADHRRDLPALFVPCRRGRSRWRTQFKCCPPIRQRENNEALWAALGEGLIEMVVSDHSPCPPEMKMRESGNFLRAWGGISSLQLRL